MVVHQTKNYQKPSLVVRTKGNPFPFINAVVLIFGGILIFICTAVAGEATEQQTLRGQIPAAVSRLQPIGRLSSSAELKLAIGLPLRNAEQLTNLLARIYDPANPGFRHYLTVEQFTRDFGPEETDYQAVMAFTKVNGMEVIATHPNRLLLDVRGSVADIERAFHVTMRTYQHPSEHRTFYAPDAEPSIDLAVPILGISGLDNYSLPRPRLRSVMPASAGNALPSSGSGPEGAYIGNDFRAAYVPGTILTGAGQSVGLLEFDGYTQSDISNYEAAAGLPSVTLSNVLIDGFNGQPSGSSGQVEVSLDIEMAISIATGLSQVISYEATNGSPFEDILNRMATDNAAQQLSCSWYKPNAGPDPVADEIFEEMAAQGQSFLNASGDSDAWKGLIDFPGETSYITQVGGTALTTAGPGGPWVSETVWNQGDGAGSAGGISTNYPIPFWQTNVSMANNQGSATMRNVPDVALTAQNVYVRAYGADLTVAGTSCAAPLWAGFIALVNEQATSNTNSPLGFLNPALYQVGTGPGYASTFHDITTGDNTSPSSPDKFFAAPGYDLCTGWGTPAGQALIDALALPPDSTPPSILAQPQDQTLATGSNAVFSVAATGSPFLEYQWSFDGTNIDSATNAFLELLNVQPDEAGDYSVQITNDFGSVTSSNAILTVEPAIPPVIVAEPQNQIVAPGGLAFFSVAVTGTPPAYQWSFNGDAIASATNSFLALLDVQSDYAGSYAVAVTNAGGWEVSSNAALSVLAPGTSCESDTDGLVGWWAAEGNARNSVDGTLGQLDGGISFVAGEVGQAFNFDGTDADVEIGPSSGLEVGETNGFTIEAWVNPAEVTQSQPLVEWKNGARNGLMLWISIPPDFGGGGPGSLTLDLADIGNGELSTPGALIQPNVWQHVAATFDPASGIGAVYIDGTLICRTNFGSLFASTSEYVSLGYDPATTNAFTYPFGSHYRYAGQMDEVVLYNRALSTAEIQDAYNAGTYGLCPLPTTAVTVQPTNQTVLTGNTAAFTAIVNGSSPLNIQWLFDGTDIPDATNMALTLTDAQPTDSGNYAVQVSNFGGSVLSSNVMLIVSNPTPPLITTQPTNQTAAVSNSVTFRVVSTGTAPLYYQWMFDGTDIAGATNSSITVGDLLFTSQGIYSVGITNMAGATVSSNAALTVIPEWLLANAPSNGWSCVASAADGTRLIAGNSAGPIYSSADSGAAWLETTAPVNNAWKSVASSSDGTKVAAGQSGSTGSIYLSTNAGIDWVKSSAPTGICYSIACSSDGNVLAAAISTVRNAAIYVSTNSGGTWMQTSAPTTNTWAGLASSADGKKLVAVSSVDGLLGAGSIYVSTNSGGTWTLVTNGLSCSAVASSADGSRLFAIVPGSSRLDQISNGGIYASTNSGRFWTLAINPTNYSSTTWESISCSADGCTVVAATQGSAPPIGEGDQVYISTDSGNTWRNAGAPARPWTAVASSADGVKLVAAAMNNVLEPGYSDGQIYTWQSEPTLGSAFATNCVTLSWPQQWTGYVLQQNSDLTTTNWKNVPIPTVLTNGENQVLISPTNGQNFYRLEFP